MRIEPCLSFHRVETQAFLVNGNAYAPARTQVRAKCLPNTTYKDIEYQHVGACYGMKKDFTW